MRTGHLIHPVRMLLIFKTRSLLHVDWVLEFAVEKHCFEINLPTDPIFTCQKSEMESKRFEP